jgi:hypothetical protein
LEFPDHLAGRRVQRPVCAGGGIDDGLSCHW